ncbi:MAG: hypothetical protein AB1758_02360 [Candidatus Eremiobacterota bacterium]
MPRIQCTDEKVLRHVEGGQTQELAWSDLVQVKILTTDTGPFVEDFYFVLEGAGRSLVIGQSEDDGTLLARLQKLPGFDHEAVIRAAASTETAEFPCWRRS